MAAAAVAAPLDPPTGRPRVSSRAVSSRLTSRTSSRRGSKDGIASGTRILVVPGEKWPDLPRSLRRLLLRDALLTEPSPAVQPMQDGRRTSFKDDTESEEDWPTSMELTADGRRKHVLIKPLQARTEAPRQAEGADLPRTTTEQGAMPPRALSGPLVAAATRWHDVMEHLVVIPDSHVASSRVDYLRRITFNGHNVPSTEALSEAFPEMAELMRDGTGGLLSLPVLQRIYAALTTAFAGLCSSVLELPVEPETPLAAACAAYCDARQEAHRQALETMRLVEGRGDTAATELACNEAIALNPTVAEPFLVRAGCRLSAGMRWPCVEDLRIYLWWSTREGLDPERHATAYWRMGQAFLDELEWRAAKQGMLLDDGIFNCLLDEAEASLRFACRFDRSGELALSSAAKAMLQRIEGHRAARRTKNDLNDTPVVADSAAAADDEVDDVEPSVHDYSVPWPIDLSAGLPDSLLFSRMPTIGTSHEHEPLELLFLDARGVLDLLATVQGLATRAMTFAQRNAACLHWKYRPKPVQLHLQVPVAERLAHALLCVMIAKQMGTASGDGEQMGTASSLPAFTMEETDHDRFLCSLLTAVVFCRTLTPPQRAEVDRILALLVFASMDDAYMRRTFPWLDIDDGRKTLVASESGEEGGSGRPGSGNDVEGGSKEASGQKHTLTIGGENAWGTSVLLFRLQQIWLGWLATAGGEAAAARPRGVGKALARVDEAAVHSTARRLLLGPRAAALCPALDLASAASNGGFGSGISQRRLWALFGHLPAGPKPAAEEGEEEAQKRTLSRTWSKTAAQVQNEDDPAARMQPKDPRARWRPLLDELADVKPSDWRLNPCTLDPVAWTYDPGALADPFRVFSWRLQDAGSGAAAFGAQPRPWYAQDGPLFQAVDRPLPPPGSAERPALEEVWEHIMPQLKLLSAVFNALEAADSARARAMVPVLTAQKEAPKEPKEMATSASSAMSGEAGKRAPHAGAMPAPSFAPHALASPETYAYQPGHHKQAKHKGHHHHHHHEGERTNSKSTVHIKVTSELRQRVAEEDYDGHKEYLIAGTVERELEDLKRQRHEASLDLELRDYVTLDSVRKKEADWWGRGGPKYVSYKEAMEAGNAATWNPAPAACPPLRMQLHVFVGSPWQAAKMASSRGLSFDAIDARSLLCSGVGLLGLCTWFDSFLKNTPHSYIQTRHCEELFLRQLHEGARGGSGLAQGISEAEMANPNSSPPQLVIGNPQPRNAGGLANSEARCPPQSSENGLMATTLGATRRAVLSQTGRMQWAPAKEEAAPPTTPRVWGTGTGRRPQLRMTLPAGKVTSPRPGAEPKAATADPMVLYGREECTQALAGRMMPAPSYTQKGPKLPQLPPTPRDVPSIPSPSPVPSTLPPPSQAATTQGASRPQPALAGVPFPAYMGAYDVESSLFDHLVKESFSTRVTSAQMQYLLGVAARAEPLWGELSLDYLGAASLPVRHDFLTWDSTLEASSVLSRNWPCTIDRISEEALGGTRKAAPRLCIKPSMKPRADPLSVLNKYWKQPNGKDMAQALGPRLLRIRRLGTHPSLNLGSAPRRCANAAFCSQPAAAADSAIGGTFLVSCHCPECACVWYCSAACQASHRTAHEFECRALQALKNAATSFETRGLEKNKKTLATLIETALARQFSMVASAGELTGCTVLGEDLQQAICGARRERPLRGRRQDDDWEIGSDLSDDDEQRRETKESLRRDRSKSVIGKDQRSSRAMISPRRPSQVPSALADPEDAAVERPHQVSWTEMVVVPEASEQWRCNLSVAALEAKPQVPWRLGGKKLPSETVGPRGLFDVRMSHAHTSAGVIRLMSRWCNSQHRAPALREVIDEGLIFCVITGLSQTKQFLQRQPKKHAVVSVLAHRMALHIAASQQWRALAPSLVPPLRFQEQGLQGIETAPYSAYYAFLQPLRLPFAQLRPLLPIICIVWGEKARSALLSLPHTPVGGPQAPAGSPKRRGSAESAAEAAKAPSASWTQGRPGAAQGGGARRQLTTFLEAASANLADIQLVDCVQMDVMTGQAIFLMYASVLEGRSDEAGHTEASVMLLDASRGMQAIACPISVRELRRCAL